MTATERAEMARRLLRTPTPGQDLTKSFFPLHDGGEGRAMTTFHWLYVGAWLLAGMLLGIGLMEHLRTNAEIARARMLEQRAIECIEPPLEEYATPEEIDSCDPGRIGL